MIKDEEMQTRNEVEKNEMPKSEQEGYAITDAEVEQVATRKRDKLYRSMQIFSIAFAAVSIVVMVVFKMNEGFFDASSRIGILMKSVNAQEDSILTSKVNVWTSFKDEEKSRLVIPLTEPIDSEDVSIRQEFIQNKYVIVLSKYSQNVPNGVELVSDSSIMDAVGVYRQNNDVVVEVYCRDFYDYELITDSSALIVNFKNIGDSYTASAVVWFPWEDRNRLALPEWRQSLEQFAADHHIKLYMVPDMQEEYTQEDVILFANRIHADMVLGVQVEETSGQQSYMTGICNTTYFIPGYNSAHLSVVMAEAFVEAIQVGIHEFEEADGRNVLVSEATVPSAIIKISLTQKDMESVENEYKLNGKIVEALEKTMSDILQDYLIKSS